MTPADDPSDFRSWVFKAEQDFAMAALGAAAVPLRSPDTVCFLSQQCCEKYLKAYLIQHGIAFPKTHDLDALLELGIGAEPGLDRLQASIEPMAPYAVALRYPGLSATEEQARDAVASSRAVRAAIRERLGMPAETA